MYEAVEACYDDSWVEVVYLETRLPLREDDQVHPTSATFIRYLSSSDLAFCVCPSQCISSAIPT